MPLELAWRDISIRLTLAVISGTIIGFNRGEHGRPAGMRTTLLVCLAAALSLILANALINTVGHTPGSFVQLDMMRLPLGVLSGMGFIGAGAILRRGSLVLGITTAATLWYVTMMGMCFGAGQNSLGLVALALGLFALWGLKHVEARIAQDVQGTLSLTLRGDATTEAELQQQIARSHCKITSWGTAFDREHNTRQIWCALQWRPPAGDVMPPPIVKELQNNPAINSLQWKPQGLAGESEQQTKPSGTPTSLQA